MKGTPKEEDGNGEDGRSKGVNRLWLLRKGQDGNIENKLQLFLGGAFDTHGVGGLQDYYRLGITERLIYHDSFSDKTVRSTTEHGN